MDFHIPLVFIYAGMFLLSFIFLDITFSKVQQNAGGAGVIPVFIAGIVLYVASAIYTTEYIRFLTVNEGWFVFGISALVLLCSYFFKWQKWLLYFYSAFVVVMSLLLHFNLL